MEYRVCQDVNYTEWRLSCRGGMAGCFPSVETNELEVCGDWKTKQEDAYASFYTVLNRATNCELSGMRCSSATPVGEPELRTNESGALKAAGADEKSVGDSILGIFKMMWESFKKMSSSEQPMIWD